MTSQGERARYIDPLEQIQSVIDMWKKTLPFLNKQITVHEHWTNRFEMLQLAVNRGDVKLASDLMIEIAKELEQAKTAIQLADLRKAGSFKGRPGKQETMQ